MKAHTEMLLPVMDGLSSELKNVHFIPSLLFLSKWITRCADIGNFNELIKPIIHLSWFSHLKFHNTTQETGHFTADIRLYDSGHSHRRSY